METCIKHLLIIKSFLTVHLPKHKVSLQVWARYKHLITSLGSSSFDEFHWNICTITAYQKGCLGNLNLIIFGICFFAHNRQAKYTRNKNKNVSRSTPEFSFIFVFFHPHQGSTTGVRGWKYAAEARWQDIWPDGQEPRWQADAGGVPGRQQSWSTHCASAQFRWWLNQPELTTVIIIEMCELELLNRLFNFQRKYLYKPELLKLRKQTTEKISQKKMLLTYCWRENLTRKQIK